MSMPNNHLEFDPNMRRQGMFSMLNDQRLGLQLGDTVTVYEPEDDIQASGIVKGFWGESKKYVLVAVDPDTLTIAGDSNG